MADDVAHIGKEANNIDDQALEVRKAQSFLDKIVIMETILAMPQKIAEVCGVDRKTFQRMKQRIRENGDLNLKTPAVKRIISYFHMF